MAKAKTLRDQIDRLRGIRTQLTAPEEFWTAHKDEYREILAQVTLRELTPLRPQDMEPEEWEYHVSLLAAGIQAALLNETETGLRFWLGPASQPQADEIAGPAPGIFGQETIMEWVAAGREGDESGKHLDERDAGRDDEEIAKRVWWAMYTGRSLHSHDLIRKFLVDRGVQFVQEALPALLTAWKEGVIVRLKDDWKRYLREVATGGTLAPF
jgi:hypothetical protein